MIKRFRNSFFGGLGIPQYVRFDGGGGAGGSGGSGGSSGDGGAGGNGGQGGDGKDKQPFAVFPDEVSFMSRVSRDAKQKLEADAKAAGFDSVDALLAAAKKAKEADEAAKTEQQRLADAKAAAEKAAAAEKTRADNIAIRAEARLIAKDLGFIDVDDAYKLADLSGAKVDAEGNVTGVKEVLEKLAKDKPHLIKAADGKPAGSSGSAGGGQRGGGSGKTPEEIAKELAEARNKGSQPKEGAYDPWKR